MRSILEPKTVREEGEPGKVVQLDDLGQKLNDARAGISTLEAERQRQIQENLRKYAEQDLQNEQGRVARDVELNQVRAQLQQQETNLAWLNQRNSVSFEPWDSTRMSSIGL